MAAITYLYNSLTLLSFCNSKIKKFIKINNLSANEFTLRVIIEVTPKASVNNPSPKVGAGVTILSLSNTFII